MDLQQALAALGLPANFDEPALKSQYRKLALELHPDKSRLDKTQANAVFATLTLAFKTALEHLAGNRGSQFHELRAAHNAVPRESAPPPISKNFNAEIFNRTFDEHRIREYMDDGHQQWLEGQDLDEQDSDAADVTTVSKYVEPKPAMNATSLCSTYELGTERVDDFSGTNIGNNELCFMDVRKAYRPPEKVQFEQRPFETVKDLEAARSQVTYSMTPEEQDQFDRIAQLREQQEARRMERLRSLDRAYGERFERVNRLLLVGGNAV